MPLVYKNESRYIILSRYLYVMSVLCAGKSCRLYKTDDITLQNTE